MILILNAGSSTLKFKLYSAQSGAVLSSGVVERIGEPTGPADHGTALKMAIAILESGGSFRVEDLIAVGHRIVHGGNRLAAIERVDAQNRSRIRSLLVETIPLAPLHNPPAIQCFDAIFAAADQIPHVLVFDTGFFHQLPEAAHRYALPAWCYDDHQIRRYGAHGTSHQFVAGHAMRWLRASGLENRKIITLHLGNGASVAAIDDGLPIDTSMGLTPLEGLVMGTRCGDIDPAIIPFLQRNAGLTADQVDDLLNRQSGLKGMCGSNDMRMIQQMVDAGDPTAMLALEIYCRRIRKYIGAYAAILEGLDAIVFTAGVGQHSPMVRQRVCEPLTHLGVAIDGAANADNRTLISSARSAVAVLVMATDEELAIFQHVRDRIAS
jgi:acetate kinase